MVSTAWEGTPATLGRFSIARFTRAKDSQIKLPKQSSGAAQAHLCGTAYPPSSLIRSSILSLWASLGSS